MPPDFAGRFAPCYVMPSHVHRVLAYPMRRTSLPSNAVSVFISGIIQNQLIKRITKKRLEQ